MVITHKPVYVKSSLRTLIEAWQKVMVMLYKQSIQMFGSTPLITAFVKCCMSSENCIVAQCLVDADWCFCVNYRALLPLHNKSVVSIFESSVTAAERFQGDKRCIVCSIISRDFHYCLNFIFCAWLSVVFAALLCCRRPLQKLSAVNSWDFLWQSISKPECLSCALTTPTLLAPGNRQLNVQCFLGES